MRIRIRQERANGQQHLGNRKRRTPLFLQDVETDLTRAVHVAVVDSSSKRNLRRFERIINRKLDIEEENSTAVRRPCVDANKSYTSDIFYRHRPFALRGVAVRSSRLDVTRSRNATTHRSAQQSSTPIHTSYRPSVRRCSLSEVRAKSPPIPSGCASRFRRASSSCQTSLLFRSVTKSNFEKRDFCLGRVVVRRALQSVAASVTPRGV